MRGALALSEHLAGLSLFATPIQLAGGSPLLAYNVCLILSYALSGWFAYLLVLPAHGIDRSPPSAPAWRSPRPRTAPVSSRISRC